MYAGFERIVVLTDQDRDALLRLNPRTPVAVIPNGVRTFAPAPERRPTSPPSLVFVGNYAYGPNVRAAVALVSDILPRVRAHVPDVRVVLVGVNAPARVRSLAGADVEVTGPVPDIAPFLARASCFVAPLVQGAGMKNKVLEAMAAGLPAVGTPLAMEGIAVTPGEHVLTGSTPAELAAQVTRLLRDPRLAQQVGARARALVERHYTWAQVAERYESLYREVIGEHAGRDA
jgi:glycosyltransferase involved in cell wall biosynthesis